MLKSWWLLTKFRCVSNSDTQVAESFTPTELHCVGGDPRDDQISDHAQDTEPSRVQRPESFTGLSWRVAGTP